MPLIKGKLNCAELMRNFSYKLLVIITDDISRLSPGDRKLMHDAQSHSHKINMILLMTFGGSGYVFYVTRYSAEYVDTRHEIYQLYQGRR